MCTTSMSLHEINSRLDEPKSVYTTSSPSSISDVDLRARHESNESRKELCADSKTSNEDSGTGSPRSAPSGDSLVPVDDGRTDSSITDLGSVNAEITPALSTSPTQRKRRWSDVVVNEEAVNPSKRVQLGDDEKNPTLASQVEDRSQARSESAPGSSVGQLENTADDYDDDVCYSPAFDIDYSEERYSRRTLYIEYWSRTDECKERKWDHLDEIAEKYGSAEDHIFSTTLNGRTACLEPNMFPYNTPAGIEHWTLWHVSDLNHEQIKQYVENWIDANAPHVHRWNYDDNPERSIDIFHVHVYLQVGDSDSVLQGRKVEELMHECD